jgi:hypothetical protein
MFRLSFAIVGIRAKLNNGRGSTGKAEDAFSCVPSLPGWSFLRIIYGGVRPLPLFPSTALGARGFPHG